MNEFFGDFKDMKLNPTQDPQGDDLFTIARMHDLRRPLRKEFDECLATLKLQWQLEARIDEQTRTGYLSHEYNLVYYTEEVGTYILQENRIAELTKLKNQTTKVNIKE